MQGERKYELTLEFFPFFCWAKFPYFSPTKNPPPAANWNHFHLLLYDVSGCFLLVLCPFLMQKTETVGEGKRSATVQSTPVSALNECLKDFMSNFLPGGIPPKCTTIFSKDAEFSCVLGCHFTSWTFVCVCVCVHFRSHATSVTLGVRTFIWHLNDIWKWEVFFTSLNVFVFAWVVYVFGCRWHAEQNRPAINFKPKTPNTQRYHRGRLRWLGCRCFGAGCVRKTAHCTSY